ncbi:MAG: hypothetical protein RR448_10150 [Niameybacter sp.]|uniref:hypothetical protein n=2 Tax=Niameybacter sp. TaxID=2033640 RepID=UPI002FC6AFB8
MKKKIISMLVFVILTSGIIGLAREYYIKEVIIETKTTELEDPFYTKYKMNVLKVIEEHLLHEELLYIDENVRTNVQILYMEYLLKNNQEALFKQTLKKLIEDFLTQDKLLSVGGYIQQDDSQVQPIPKWSLGDNLKVYKLMIRASKIWQNELYETVANQLSDQIYRYNVVKNKLYSYHDPSIGEREGEIALDDFDLKALGLLAEQDVRWKGTFQKSKEIVEKGYIGHNLPLYYTYYNYEEKTYGPQEKIDILQSLRIVQHLSESGICKSDTIKWLKEQIKAGGVYEQYDVKTGIVTSHKEAVAIYAVISQIGKNIGDIELYTLAMEKMLNFQVKDKQHQYFGAFMEKDKDRLNDYDLVQALLAF